MASLFPVVMSRRGWWWWWFRVGVPDNRVLVQAAWVQMLVCLNSELLAGPYVGKAGTACRAKNNAGFSKFSACQ